MVLTPEPTPTAGAPRRLAWLTAVLLVLTIVAGGFVFLFDATQTLYAVHADDGLVSWQLAMPGFKNMKKKKNQTIKN